MTLDCNSGREDAAPPRELYLGAAVALPFAVLIWAALLGTIFARL